MKTFGRNIMYNVAKTSFYDALKWERDHPAKKWDGDRIRQRGKISLLTYDMDCDLAQTFWLDLGGNEILHVFTEQVTVTR